jgi:hypothetical protein
MAAATHPLTVDARQFLPDLTLTVHLTHLRRLRFRLRLGSALVRLAAWVLGCRVTVAASAALHPRDPLTDNERSQLREAWGRLHEGVGGGRPPGDSEGEGGRFSGGPG